MAKRGLLMHTAIYVVVILFLLAINLSTYPKVLWIKWPMMGWGLGLLFHVLGVVLFTRSERQIRVD